MTYPILKTTGSISHYGAWTAENGANSYATIEVHTANGLVELKNVICPAEAHRVISGFKQATILYTQVEGKNASLVIWGILDHESGRVFTNDQVIDARKARVLMAIGQVVPMGFLTLVGLCLFVIPGLFFAYGYYKIWAAALAWPTAEEVKAALDDLKAVGAQLSPLPSLASA